MELNDIMCTYLKTVSSSLESNIKSKGTINHTHPPVRFIVPGCPYCAMHGNVFVISN